MPRVPVILHTDPGCPFGYSASPALARLRWRFGEALEWRLVLIGLAETSQQYEQRGHTPLDMARGALRFRRHGMPFEPVVKPYVAPTTRACRALVAVRELHPGREWAALRALQLVQFTTPLTLDDDGALETALARVPGVDAAAAVAAIEDDWVVDAYENDRAMARTAAGTPASAQGKTAATDGPERFSAPTLVIDDRWVAGGFQPYAAYDVLVANVDPNLPRRPPAETPVEVLTAFGDALTTAEIAACMTPGVDEPNLAVAEDALLEAARYGELRRDGALWAPAREQVRAAA